MTILEASQNASACKQDHLQAYSSWLEPLLTSLTCLVPRLTIKVFAVTAVQKPVSSQFQRHAVEGSLKSRLTPFAHSSTRSNQPLIISGWEASALFLLKCCGLRSLKQGQRTCAVLPNFVNEFLLTPPLLLIKLLLFLCMAVSVIACACARKLGECKKKVAMLEKNFVLLLKRQNLPLSKEQVH